MSNIFKTFLFIAIATIVIETAAIAYAYYVHIGSYVPVIPQPPKVVEQVVEHREQPTSNITWGVDFSQSQAEYLQLDWRETYQAIINDLGAKHIKLHTNWSWVEGKEDDLFFNDIDWQLREAEEQQVKIIYVIGMKTGRWPECHVPTWAEKLSAEKQQAAVLQYIKTVVERYKNSKAIAYWQIENEPFLRFGRCPSWYYESDEFLKNEVALLRSLDPSRQIIISDSGELSDWFAVARIGDIVGITLYRNAWVGNTETFGHDRSYTFLQPVVYKDKAALIEKNFHKPVIGIELQAEPWASKPLVEASIEEQSRSMNLSLFQENISFAKQTGLTTFYFWGVEWWYWMKTKHDSGEIWNEAKNVFREM